MEKLSKFNMERFFVALSERTRLRIVNLIGDGEVCVCFFVEVLGEGQPKISRHLAYLRRAGMVAGRRDEKWMRYRIVTPANPHAERILKEVMIWLKDDNVPRKALAGAIGWMLSEAPAISGRRDFMSYRQEHSETTYRPERGRFHQQATP